LKTVQRLMDRDDLRARSRETRVTSSTETLRAGSIEVVALGRFAISKTVFAALGPGAIVAAAVCMNQRRGIPACTQSCRALPLRF
jgi:hypothetical protein